ncbi:MAG: sigma-54-dependent Fis family transcriptional regulator [Nitrospirae bacterium]|nr:sigma-54-dependent Fis family transcriptional regulator [Nitrospirota bacterium]
MKKLLIVDDEKSMREFLAIVLRKEGYYVATAADGESALRLLEQDIFDLVMTDMKMPGMDGLALLRAIKQLSSRTVVLMITAFASTENAVEAMKAGAYDYLTKPFQIDEVKLLITKALDHRNLEEENRRLKEQFHQLEGFEQLIGRSAGMQRVLELINKVADSNSNVLIFGESGTGKELVARALHSRSHRKDKPFVTINCGALPEPLLESELFGHMKGSFTGAVSNKEGLFEVAHEGTIFLDEVGDTPSSIQVKLLRVLQEKEFRRIGGTKDIRVDVRVIAATNKDLEKAVADGAFREDLYYRLDVIPIHLPPLRERRDDIPMLVDHFVAKYGRTGAMPVTGLAPGALQVLAAQEWRGNVRELEHLIERAVTLATGPLLTPDLLTACLQRPDSAAAPIISDHLPPDGIDLEAMVSQLERKLLLQALDRTGGVKKRAAQLLGLNFRSFRYRLEKYGIKRGRDDGEADEEESASNGVSGGGFP